MNKRQKEVEAAKLSAEEKELKHLKAIYNKAAEDIQKKIRISDGKINFLLSEFDNLDDEQKSILQSQIYQRQFQESLQKQIDSFTASLNSGQYKSINEYLKGCYETGYIGTMYDIAGQGIPLIMPIDQKAVTRAMTHNTKLSTTLYKRLGVDLNLLKKRIANNISRGIATASEYRVIARNIAADSNVGFNRSMRIARTEGHRIQIESAVDAQHAAKDAGADIVKQWDAALDGRTRPHHRMLDGQIRELDEPFEVDGMKVMHPSGFGRASEDVNCRCALLQRARWALDEEELNKLKERAAYFGLDKTNSFNDFKDKYLKAAEEDYRIFKELTLDEFKKMKHTISKDERKIIYGKGHFSGYINSSNARKINGILREGGELPSDWQEIADTLQNIITKNVLSDDIIVTRYVTDDTLEALTGVKMPVATLRTNVDDFWKAIDDIPNQIEKGHIYTEKGFLSTSGVADKNVMTQKGIRLKIKALKGTNCYVTTNNKESEIIFGRNTTLKITGVRIEDNRTANRKVVLECIIE